MRPDAHVGTENVLSAIRQKQCFAGDANARAVLSICAGSNHISLAALATPGSDPRITFRLSIFKRVYTLSAPSLTSGAATAPFSVANINSITASNQAAAAIEVAAYIAELDFEYVHALLLVGIFSSCLQCNAQLLRDQRHRFVR